MPHQYLDLRTIPPEQQAAAVVAFDKGNARRLMGLLDDTAGVEFVGDNGRWLQEQGIYEECLFIAFTSIRTNLYRWETGDLRALVDQANRNKLRDAGDALPDGRQFTVYRGVAGRPRWRHNSGPSWTSSLDAACWYALRNEYLYGPGVRVTTLKRSEARPAFPRAQFDAGRDRRPRRRILRPWVPSCRSSPAPHRSG